MAPSEIGSLVFIDDVTAESSSMMNCKMYRHVLFSQIQPEAPKLIGQCFTVQSDDDVKHPVKATQEFLNEKKLDIL